MPFSIACTNKGCYKINQAYIDPKTDKVYCSECDKEIVNITYFTKAQLKSNKQFKKEEKESFTIKCNNCQVTKRPIIVKDKITCASCNKEITSITEQFKIMLKQFLNNASKDI